MGGYILRRCLAGLVTLLVASFLVFLLVAVSGNPLANLEANPHISQATIQAASLSVEGIAADLRSFPHECDGRVAFGRPSRELSAWYSMQSG